MVEILGTELDLLTLVISVVIFAAGVLAASIARVFVTRFTTPRLPADVSRLVTRAAFWTIIAIAAFSAIGNAGVDFTGVLVAAGIFGVVLGFALQPVVVNLISGLFLQLDRTAKVGDPVQLVEPDVAGIVLDINVFSTRIRTFDGVFVRVPNDRVFTSQIRNFSSTAARRVDMTVTIAYKEDAEKARKLIREMLDNNPHVLTDPAPEVMTWELAENSVNILVWPWVPSSAWLTLRKQMAEDVKNLLDENKIEIPFPQRTVWFGEPKQGEKGMQSVTRKGSEMRRTQADSTAT
jgi:small-conductance mechanosensitive channel